MSLVSCTASGRRVPDPPHGLHADFYDLRPCRAGTPPCGGRVELLTGSCTRCGSRILRPLPGPQTDFLACTADIALFGGGMGGGKTRSMLLDWLRHSQTPGTNGLIVRNRLTDITVRGGLWDDAQRLYDGTAGVDPDGIMLNPRFRAGNMLDAEWPSGATLSFRHLDQYNVHRFKGPGFSWIGVEEANECDLEAIMWLFLARGRSTSGARPVLRMTCNPDPDHQLAEWVSYYLLPDGTPDRSKSGVVLYILRSLRTNRFELSPDLAALAESTGQDPDSALTFAFIPSLLADNTALESVDTGYRRKFASMDQVERAKNRDGNWKIRADVRGMLRYAWWGHTEAPLSPIVRRVRAWDLASSVPRPGTDPDYTIGVRMEWDYYGRWYITDLVACRDEATEVDKLLAATARSDYAYSPDLTQVIEIEPGSSGIRDAANTRAVLRSGCPCRVVETRANKNKAEKARPMARELRLGMNGNTPCVIDMEKGDDGVWSPRGFIMLNGWCERPYHDAGKHPATLGDLFWSQVTPFFDPSKHDDVPDAMAIAHNAGSTAPPPKRESPRERFRRLS